MGLVNNQEESIHYRKYRHLKLKINAVLKRERMYGIMHLH